MVSAIAAMRNLLTWKRMQFMECLLYYSKKYEVLCIFGGLRRRPPQSLTEGLLNRSAHGLTFNEMRVAVNSLRVTFQLNSGNAISVFIVITIQ